MSNELWTRDKRQWNDYPVGTKAKALMGGYWIKTERGWHWPNGGTFPIPGGDATGEVSLSFLDTYNQLQSQQMSNTQLPDEAVAEVSQFIKDKIDFEREYWNNNPSADSDRAKTYVAGYGKGVSAGVTEYATKLHQAEDKIVSLQRKIEKLSEENYDISGQMGSLENSTIRQTEAFCEAIRWGETARTHLDKFIIRHEAGLLPDPLLYTEINSFLNGTK